MMNPKHLLDCLGRAWSIESSSRWTAECAAAGQCSVTALVLQDCFGGELMLTHTELGPHFYNRIEGTRYDLTASQFDGPITYDDIPCSRDVAFEDCTWNQYVALKTRFEQMLGEDAP